MNMIKSLLAVSVLAAAGAAHAAPAPITATITSINAPFDTPTTFPTGTPTFTGTLNLDATGRLFGLTLVVASDYTIFSAGQANTTVTNYTGSTQTAKISPNGKIFTMGALSGSDPVGTVSKLVYTLGNIPLDEFGDPVPDSNLASTHTGPVNTCAPVGPICDFATAGNMSWDKAVLTLYADAGNNPLGITLDTYEEGAFGTATTHYNIASAPAVPVPAAAWLFGSSLIGLAGAARRRRPA